VLGGRQGAVVVHGETAGGPGLPIEASRRHMRLERRLEGWDELLKLVKSQAGQIQKLRRAVLHVGELYMCHAWCLLLGEAQYTTNRDNLKCLEPKTPEANKSVRQSPNGTQEDPMTKALSKRKVAKRRG